MFRKVDPKKKYSEMEKEIVKYWKKNRTFEKSVDQRSQDKYYSFYDGPPFITGVPHYGTLLSSIAKDAVPRYWTMKGCRVERRWGWDCHGLPAENMVEKKLGIKSKGEIEKTIGIAKFNEACFKEVSQIADEWEEVVDRIGRWVEFKNAYKTMDRNYMESVWWAFKQLYDKGLVYQDARVSLYCPRCATPLSNFEIAMDNSYEMDKDPSVYIKLKVKSEKLKVEEEDTYFLVWTTTPWTLPANVALAVGNNFDYVKIRIKNKELGIKDDIYFVEKNRAEFVTGDDEYEILKELKGADLVGLEYEPLFPHDIENGYRVIAGDFVTTEDGTGIVHLAPAFGEDDFNARATHGLPMILNVDEEGKFKEGEWKGMSVWEANGTVVGWLKEHNYLFKKENITHSYPHCHRCHTKLIYKAQDAWFVNVDKIRDKLIAKNENIKWHPEFLKHGRFQKGIETAPDWNISRDRYWGTPIPVWQCDKCKEEKVIGSVDEVREQLGKPNKLFLVRHGESENNVLGIMNSSDSGKRYHLTETGISQVKKTAKSLKEKKIDMIFASPIQRTRDTAEIISKELGMEVAYDDRLREVESGQFEGKSHTELPEVFSKRFESREGNEFGLEGYESVLKRIRSFVEDINKKHKGKNIVVVSHGDPLIVLNSILQGKSRDDLDSITYPVKGESVETYDSSFDIHRPYIDDVKFDCVCGGEMKRVPQVFDSWIESGSMPFAQFHYPFENKEKFEKSFPTDFISEYIAQTRAWFYVLHVLSVGIFDKESFKNVVTTGTIAGEDGRKMSKSLGNYTDPNIVLERYSADALRFYLLSSPLFNAQNISFSETAVKDIQRKLLGTLWNSYSFFVLYANVDKFDSEAEIRKLKTKNLLDRWIVSELHKLIKSVDENMQAYDLVRATKPIEEFVDNLSNWYIRRSRKRFWKSENDTDKNQAYATLHYVLVELSKVMAPFTPFIAEEVYKNLTGKESVHLEDFPTADEKLIDETLNEEMKKTRDIITTALQLRAKAKIKVRQPLAELHIDGATNKSVGWHIDEMWKFMRSIIEEEVNVKEVELWHTLQRKEELSENDKIVWDEKREVGLDVGITEELKLEGMAREIIRRIQEMRKKAGFEVDDRIEVAYRGGETVFEKFGGAIGREILAEKITEGKMENPEAEGDMEIDGRTIRVGVRRVGR